jgi:hypothetical protein
LNRKLVILTAMILITLIATSLFLTHNLLRSQTSSREFYVGVEYAYGDQVGELKDLVDKVKNYTNLFVIGALELTFNQSALNEACDYIVNSGLHLIVLFTDSTKYDYTIFGWMQDAQQKYGDKFLGVYRFDEPGGNQLDTGSSSLVENATSYADAAGNFTESLGIIVNYYLNYTPKMFTADYGLYWFDYTAGYSTVFAEFVGNHSRQRIIALDRGAAAAFNRDWGVIVNWKYDQSPYLESGDELYSDLSLAYSSGAKYVVVFSYPQIGTYGILTEAHFEALEKFWNTLHNNIGSFGSNKPSVAYVVPADYGFGFRNPSDGIWGLFPADALSTKIYEDVTSLTAKYDSRIDILYDEPEITAPLLGNYSQVFYWNQTIT